MSDLGAPFWRFWCAAVLSNLGDGIRAAAFPLLAASLTDSAALVGAIATATALPWLLAGPPAGRLADLHSVRDTASQTVAPRLVARPSSNARTRG